MFFRLLPLALWSTPLVGQDTSSLSEEYLFIRGIDGNVYMGRLLHTDSARVVLQTTAFPELSIPRRSIKRMRRITARQARQTLLPEEMPVAGSYFVNSSAYGVRRGEVYYGTTMLLFHQVALGVSNQFSIRGSGLIDPENFYLPTWIAPKISFPIQENLTHLALEGILGRGFDSFLDLGQDASLSAIQGLFTVGDRTTNLTLGSGLSWRGGQWPQRPFLSASITVQDGRRFAFMTENYFFVADGINTYSGAVGGRIYGRRVNLDLGITMTILEFDYIFIFPILGLSINFY
ncbi:MAG: hypothetical protein RMJ33_02580 [Saprospiraceae bacterium]|nr:hypothetical protein [Saprospiraceae bacterium]